MNKIFSVRELAEGDEFSVCNLVAKSFNEFIAPEFSEQGVDEFFKYVNPRSLKRRRESGYFSMVAESDGKLAGMIELKGNNHISMLYVDKAFHRKGIAKLLVVNALKEICSQKKITEDITVNSSRYAVPFYESLGFIQFDEEKSEYGVIHTPMLLSSYNIKEITE